MNVWRMFTHHVDREGALTETRRKGRIAIGWNRVGDINQHQTQSEVKAALRRLYPVPEYSNNSHLGAPSLWDFRHEMKIGDLVILNGRAPRALVVEVTGEYQFANESSPLETNYQHRRSIQVTQYAPEKIWIAAGQDIGKPRYQTLIKCPKALNQNDL